VTRGTSLPAKNYDLSIVGQSFNGQQRQTTYFIRNQVDDYNAKSIKQRTQIALRKLQLERINFFADVFNLEQTFRLRSNCGSYIFLGGRDFNSVSE